MPHYSLLRYLSYSGNALVACKLWPILAIDASVSLNCVRQKAVTSLVIISTISINMVGRRADLPVRMSFVGLSSSCLTEHCP
eukprot:jgi/Botrbrau1/4575/Bobra.60_2s0061.1